MAMDPILLENVFDEERFLVLQHLFLMMSKNATINEDYRVFIDSKSDMLLSVVGQELLPLAKKIFNSTNMFSSYTVFSHYENDNSGINPHVDYQEDVYLIDICLYNNGEWGLCVDDKEYFLEPNCAVAFESGKSLHWRPDKPEGNITAVLLCYYTSIDKVVEL